VNALALITECVVLHETRHGVFVQLHELTAADVVAMRPTQRAAVAEELRSRIVRRGRA